MEAIEKVFENELDNIKVNSTKGLIGHCLYSVGVIEAVATIIQQREGFLHGNRNLNKTSVCNIDFCGKDSTAYVSQYAYE